MVKNFNLTKNKPLSKLCIAKGFSDFHAVFEHIKQLPYGRTINRSDYTQVIKEDKGTCSTKHAFLKAIAIENDINDLKLCLGVFKMNSENTPQLKSILETHGLNYIPEAHCYLKYDNTSIDITFGADSDPEFINDLLYEELIFPEHIGNYKVDFHQSFLKSWIKSENLKLSFNELWKIREACIIKLSE